MASTIYPPANDPTNADAIPVYPDNALTAIFGGIAQAINPDWACADWVTWHQAMVAKYGKTQADTTFLYYWNQLPTGASAIDCRSFDENFRTYMTQQNLLNSLYSGLGVIAQPIGVATDLVTSIGSGISSVGTGVKNALAILKWALPVALGVAIIFGGVWAYKNFVQKTQT